MEMNARLSADLYVNNSSNSGTTYLLLTLPLIYLTVLLDTFVCVCVHVRVRVHLRSCMCVRVCI